MSDQTKKWSAEEACKLKALKAMSVGVGHVIIDNTNTQKWEYELYLEMGLLFGYDIETITVGLTNPDAAEEYAARNTHGVPVEAIRAMAERWEK